MDPHNFISRAEAQRWLGIAEKLLIDHDLVGSKTFAIRARESDPRFGAADQILAIVDTLLAAEKRVIGNNGDHQPDFYAILQLVRLVQDTEQIASQYRRLAIMLNPHQNRFPYSDQAFQLVNEAWTVLSDPMRKSMYDAELDFPPQHQMNSIGFNLDQQHRHQQQQHEHHNFFSINHMGSDNEQELPEPHQSFQIRVERSHQQQQLQPHNFLSQNPVSYRNQEQLFQHHEQEQLFEPLEVTSTAHQQNRLPPQPPQAQPQMQPTNLPPPPPPPVAPPQPPSSWPQASPLSQLQQPQNLQQEQDQRRQEAQQQQQQEWVEQNSAPIQLPNQVNSNNGVREEETEAENVDNLPTFWTACPYCYYMYEHFRIYEECTLRCDHCKRAFQAVEISSPPSIVEGKEDYFYCWGYFPLGVSISHLPKNNGAGTYSKWTPFSPLHDASSNVQNRPNSKVAPKKNPFVNKNLGPRVYIDDETDDIFTGISEPSDDSDVEWNSTRDKR
ncbi:hypothetical protein LXL04_038582 [Taraxacum kok-saghyz]